MTGSPGYADIGGVRFGGQIVGSGSALVLLHGLAGSWEEWQLNIQALAQHFKVYAPTMPGHGDSGPIPDYRLESARDLFRAFLETEGLDKVSLVGQSMGGLLALDLALSFPGRIGKLVLIDSAGLGSEIHWGVRLLTLPILGELVCDFLWPRLSPLVVRLARHCRLPFADDLARAGTWQRGGMARLLRAGVGLRGQKLWPAIRDRLPNLTAPTLIIWGDRDELFPVSQAYAAQRVIPNARLHILRGSGHCPGPERAEEINAAILDFLLS